MSSYCIGSVISLDCANGICVQGRLAAVDPSANSISIERPFKNGRPMGQRIFTLPVAEVTNVKILKLDESSQGSEPNSQIAKVASNETTKESTLGKQSTNGVLQDRKQIHQSTPSSSCAQSGSSSPNTVNSVSSKPEKKLICANGGAHRVGGSSRHFSRACASVSPVTHYGTRRYHHRGPCGIPELDMMHDMRVKRGNRHLCRPVDFEVLNTDFDFEGNLALFDKDNLNDADNEEPEGPKTSHNYKHYENVVSDPSRLTSWTRVNGARHAYIASRIETASDGSRIPFLSFADKQDYLKAVEMSLGSDVFHALVADRLFMFLCSLLSRFAILVNQLVVLSTPHSNALLLQKFLQHLSNRACKTIVYDHYLPQKLPHVRCVRDPRRLPLNDVQLVVVLDGQFSNGDIGIWLKQLPHTTHAISVEAERTPCRNRHVLMLGVGTDPKTPGAQSAPTNDEKNSHLMAVADIGTPFTWLDDESATCLAESFATRLLVVL
uniref:DFDF domain-containing protein n=2 Tax=Parascaris univalens TaxID=6257 RepID=A0A915C5L0_PARUN